MNDLEGRVADSLRHAADAAPPAIGLAPAARRRLRRRRARTVGGLAAAVAAVVVVIPLLATLGDGDPSGRNRVATEPDTPPAPAVADGLRAETWHDVTFTVPESWRRASRTDWCATGDQSPQAPMDAAPSVSRPDTLTQLIDCDPDAALGASVGPSAAYDAARPSGDVWRYDAEGVEHPVHPDGAWLGHWFDDEYVVTVATTSRAETQSVLDSVGRLGGAADVNGCSATLGEAEALAAEADGLSLCRYDRDDLLASSTRLLGSEAAQWWQRITTAPEKVGEAACAGEPTGMRVVVVRDGDYVATAIIDRCDQGNGLFFSGVVRDLTPELRQWLWSLG